MLMLTFDVPLEIFRDACLQSATHGETEALRVSASAARAVLDAASGSRYLPRLERDHTNLWVPA